jgi:hypothetical protein
MRLMAAGDLLNTACTESSTYGFGVVFKTGSR